MFTIDSILSKDSSTKPKNIENNSINARTDDFENYSTQLSFNDRLKLENTGNWKSHLENHYNDQNHTNIEQGIYSSTNSNFPVEQYWRAQLMSNNSSGLPSYAGIGFPGCNSASSSSPNTKIFYLSYLRSFLEKQQIYSPPQLYIPDLTTLPQGKNKARRGGQVRFTGNQTLHLEEIFSNLKYISPPQRKQIAIKLGLHERQVKTWFQNRRAKWRKTKEQGDDISDSVDECIVAKMTDLDNIREEPT